MPRVPLTTILLAASALAASVCLSGEAAPRASASTTGLTLKPVTQGERAGWQRAEQAFDFFLDPRRYRVRYIAYLDAVDADGGGGPGGDQQVAGVDARGVLEQDLHIELARLAEVQPGRVAALGLGHLVLLPVLLVLGAEVDRVDAGEHALHVEAELVAVGRVAQGERLVDQPGAAEGDQ